MKRNTDNNLNEKVVYRKPAKQTKFRPKINIPKMLFQQFVACI